MVLTNFSRRRIKPSLKVNLPESTVESMWSSLNSSSLSNSKSTLSFMVDLSQILLTEERMPSSGTPLSSASNWVGGGKIHSEKP